ncbi:hypothetical protein AB1Y20_009069 [Prymnesium parvum]|uniref:Distal membrane arm assembly complex 2-like protein n=1 Tax=Prymnesium parvum TaxID=97485 RepID=A0AB34K347_PRYPA
MARNESTWPAQPAEAGGTRATRSSTRRRRLLNRTPLAATDVLNNAGEDVVGQLVADLCDPLSPWDAVALSSVCHAIRAMAEVQQLIDRLRSEHLSVRRLCGKVDMDWRLIRETQEMFWGRRSISAADCSTLGMLCGRGALQGLFRLSLDENNVGDAGVATLAHALEKHKHGLQRLAVLGLSYNNIGVTGMAALARAYSSGSLAKLAVLGLSYNFVGDAGIESFVAAISSGTLNFSVACIECTLATRSSLFAGRSHTSYSSAWHEAVLFDLLSCVCADRLRATAARICVIYMHHRCSLFSSCARLGMQQDRKRRRKSARSSIWRR